ncbi:hypothetical protein SEA_LADYBIRD_38 [Mycobacterium phage LadyBird]|uniref:hypothetical protein n=1 Tax=Mycobacterium phage LadyBird TaxID=1718166 RepID=UPI0006CE3993|nr:hypothetical protein SEA_LADYBIRD_38 [Mycobacterium phage LadyBird]ALF02179.1 hypothetical protein SEA_LADYBIRD_38 [Mycobacterium phage LadyBird]
MTLNELIEKLIAIRDEVGGKLPVHRYNTCCCYGDWDDPIGEVEVEMGIKPSHILIS